MSVKIRKVSYLISLINFKNKLLLYLHVINSINQILISTPMEMNVFLKNFVDILEDTDEALITENTVLRDLDEWDSLTALSLIAMSDEEYSVKLTGDDIKSSITLQDIFEIIKNKA